MKKEIRKELRKKTRKEIRKMNPFILFISSHPEYPDIL
jgi:hypothetical protein